MPEYYLPLMKTHSFRAPRNIIFGVGCLEMLGQEARQLGGKSVLLVSDKIIDQVGLLDKAKKQLQEKDFEIHVFNKVEPEPTVENADEITSIVRESRYDLVVGVGGGSVLDMAKTASIMATNSGSIRDYFGKEVPKKGLQKILIPTTAGTGSEVSEVILLTDKGMKPLVRSSKNLAEIAIVDPLMSITMPPKLTAATGLDALSHAIGAILSLGANPMTDTLGLKAVEMVSQNLRIAYNQGNNLQARYHMALAATIGMLSAANAGGAGLSHSLANTVASKFHMPHGESCALALPYTMNFNAQVCPEKLKLIAVAMGENVTGISIYEAAHNASVAVKKLVEDTDNPSSLRQLDDSKDYLQGMVEDLMTKYQRGFLFNPRKVDRRSAINLYEEMWEGKLKI